ncbi:MAG: hypothetical protein OEM02_14455 [Desulfobulbaceae bacterium]|nr:hypothetical protein [Desulfobulbaceae bacterium]
MSQIYLVISFLLICFNTSEATAFSFFKSCTPYNQSPDSGVYHQIINADILKIGSNQGYAFGLVECQGVPRRYAFSRYNDGVPIFPDSSVVIDKNKTEVCEGDLITVYGRNCKILSLTTEKR